MLTSWQWQLWYAKQLQSTNTTNSTFCKQMTMSFLRTEPQISCSSHEQPQSLISLPTMSTMPDGWLIIFLCSSINISLFLIYNTPLQPSCQGNCVHVGCSVFWASKTHQNANVCKNCTLVLIHWDSYDPRYMVDRLEKLKLITWIEHLNLLNCTPLHQLLLFYLFMVEKLMLNIQDQKS